MKQTSQKQQFELHDIDVALIENPKLAMRLDTEKANIDDLAKSIDKVGLINPITLIRVGKYYEVVAGFRRFLAIKKLEMKSVSAFLIEQDTEQNLAVMTAENYERENVNTFDEAIYLSKILKQTELSQKALAKVISRSESYVSERIAILKYPDDLRDALSQGKISFSVARELDKIKDTADKVMYTRYAVQNGCTPDVAKRWRLELDERGKQTADSLAEEATEHYNEQTNRTTVMMICKICNDNVDVNDLQTMYVCKSCVDVLRKAAAI